MHMLWIKINLDNAKLSTYPENMILYISIIIFYLFQYSKLIKPTIMYHIHLNFFINDPLNQFLLFQ